MGLRDLTLLNVGDARGTHCAWATCGSSVLRPGQQKPTCLALWRSSSAMRESGTSTRFLCSRSRSRALSWSLSLRTSLPRSPSASLLRPLSLHHKHTLAQRSTLEL